MQLTQQLNATIIMIRSIPTSPDVFVLVLMMIITMPLIYNILMSKSPLATACTRYPLEKLAEQMHTNFEKRLVQAKATLMRRPNVPETDWQTQDISQVVVTVIIRVQYI